MVPPRKLRQGKGLPIREGSVREARFQAGLTLEQVAAGQVSRAAIHAIETGRSHPTTSTLQLIARVTHQPLSFFVVPGQTPADELSPDRLEADLLATRLEGLLYTGHEEEALRRAVQALERQAPGRKDARLMLIAIDAHLRLSQAAEATPLIRSAMAVYEQKGDRYGVVECLDRDGYAKLLTEDPAAPMVFKRAITQCRQLDPCPSATLSRLLCHLGSWCVQAHDWSAAIDAYREAVHLGDSISDLHRVGQMYGDLAAAYQQLGDLDEALRYAHKAVAFHEARTDQHSIVRAENNLGMTLLRAGDHSGAEKHVRRALALSEVARYEVGRVHVLLSLAETELAAGKINEACANAAAALDEATRLDEGMSAALAQRILGEAAAKQGDLSGVRRYFTAALSALGASAHRERLIETYEAYSRALEELGHEKEALNLVREALFLSRPQFGSGDRLREAMALA